MLGPSPAGQNGAAQSAAKKIGTAVACYIRRAPNPQASPFPRQGSSDATAPPAATDSNGGTAPFAPVLAGRRAPGCGAAPPETETWRTCARPPCHSLIAFRL